MALSHDELKSLSLLARLGLSDQDLQDLSKDFNHIVSYVERLQHIDIEGVKAMTHAIPMDLPLRPDIAQPVAGVDCLRGSQGFEDGLVRVPKIID